MERTFCPWHIGNQSPFFLNLDSLPPLGSLCRPLVLENSTVFSSSTDELGASQLWGEAVQGNAANLFTFVHAYTCCVCVHVHMCVCVHIYAYVHMYEGQRLTLVSFSICVHVHVYVHIYMYICTCMKVSFSIVHHVIFRSRVFIEPGPRLS